LKVSIPTPLRSYTEKASLVRADGDTVAALLWDLDRRYPGIRFRMIDEQDAVRPHIRIFVNGERRRDLDMALSTSDEIQILQALSGG
jgi:molybdopterin converting factor small subunit